MYNTIKSLRASVNSFGVSCYQDSETMQDYNRAVSELGKAIRINN
jgi:hypothetical protein